MTRKQHHEIIKLNIVKLLNLSEPLTLSSIHHKLGVDNNLLKKLLLELVDKGEIAYSKILHLSNSRQKNDFYFIFPLSIKITSLLWYEQYWTQFDSEYYFGIKPNIPLFVQFWHKTIMFGNRLKKLQKLMLRRNLEQSNKKLEKIHDEINSFMSTTLWQSKLIRNILVDIDVKSKMENSYLLIHSIDFLDKKYLIIDEMTSHDLKIDSTLTDNEKYQIVCALLGTTKRHLAKHFGVSTKTISKIQKEFSNDDGTINTTKINQLIEKNLGVKNSHFGEKLEKKRKRLSKTQ